MYRLTLILAAALVAAACQTTPVADVCTPPLDRGLNAAIQDVETRLAAGCEYHCEAGQQSGDGAGASAKPLEGVEVVAAVAIPRDV